LSWCVKVDTLGRLCDDDLERSYDPFTTTNIYILLELHIILISLIIYKPSTLIISPHVRATGHKTPGESSEIRMRLLKGCSTLYTKFTFLVSGSV